MLAHEKKCTIIMRVSAFLDQHPDAIEKLEALLHDGKILLDTSDVAQLTGWSDGHILRLCKQDLLPHIPGNPHKFMIKPLREALERMQTGGIYGRQKTRRRRAA